MKFPFLHFPILQETLPAWKYSAQHGHKTFAASMSVLIRCRSIKRHKTASRLQTDSISFILSHPQADAKLYILQLEIETKCICHSRRQKLLSFYENSYFLPAPPVSFFRLHPSYNPKPSSNTCMSIPLDSSHL